MTAVAFHFGAPDKVAYACRLLRKVTAKGLRAWVVVPVAQQAQLDAALWAVSSTDFVAHCSDQDEPALQVRSQVVLGQQVPASGTPADVLVNLAQSVPNGFERFDRVVEVVGVDDDDRAPARARWKHYTQLGYTIERHDLTLRG